MSRLLRKTSIIFIASMLYGCGASTGTVVKDIGIGIQAADCFFQNYTSNLNAGFSEGDSAVKAAITCGLSEAQATGLLNQHKAAMAAEKCGGK